MDHYDFLAEIPFFSCFTGYQITKLSEIFTQKHYPKDSIVFMEKDPCDRVFINKSGKIKALKTSAEGKEFLVKVFNEGDFFGEACIFINKGSYPITAMASEPTEILYTTERQLKKILLEEPQIALALLEIYSKKMVYLMGQIAEITSKNVKSRVIRFLFDSIPEENRNDENPVEIRLNLSRTEIASKLGTVREHISRTFSKLSNEGLIESHGKNIIICNLKKLKSLAKI